MIFSAFISSIFFFLFFVADGLLCIDLQCVGTRGVVVVIMYSLSIILCNCGRGMQVVCMWSVWIPQSLIKHGRVVLCA